MPGCEVPPETDGYGTICELNNDECTPSCPEGRVLPKGQREQKFRCGVSTNYEWVPMKNLPICASKYSKNPKTADTRKIYC